MSNVACLQDDACLCPRMVSLPQLETNVIVVIRDSIAQLKNAEARSTHHGLSQ